mgnify:CR=1 FL=1
MEKKNQTIEKGTRWYQRLRREVEAMSPHIRFRRIKFGFYRIYWVGDGESAYIGECSKDMPQFGYDLEERNYQLESQKYFEEYEDNAELIQKIKNFREGYWGSIYRLRTNIYLLKNNAEHRKEAQAAYSQFVVK